MSWYLSKSLWNSDGCIDLDANSETSPALLKVLEFFAESGGVSAELHEVHHQSALPPLPLHRGVCSPGHAALWGTVSKPSRTLLYILCE